MMYDKVLIQYTLWDILISTSDLVKTSPQLVYQIDEDGRTAFHWYEIYSPSSHTVLIIYLSVSPVRSGHVPLVISKSLDIYFNRILMS